MDLGRDGRQVAAEREVDRGRQTLGGESAAVYVVTNGGAELALVATVVRRPPGALASA